METTDTQRLVKLKNGSEEPANLVAVTMVSIGALAGRDPIAFYELVMKSRDPKHKVWSDAQVKTLSTAGLMGSDGHVHGSIANVVACAVTGEGLAMKLGDPRASQESGR